MHISRYAPRMLPESLSGLADLALDMRWSWNHASDELWRTIDQELWDATGNPWYVLGSVATARFESLAADTEFLVELDRQLEIRQKALSQPAWFSKKFNHSHLQGIAYFSMEFGMSEALPLYSGGLGILAGDHLKTASDLDVPLIGIGLLYQQGYFRQGLDRHGHQLEFYPYNDPAALPVMPLRDAKGNWLKIRVELPGRTLVLRAWEVQVGRIRLLLLDSNDPINTPGDRGITAKLYGGGQEIRLQQEIVLGLGGWRLINELGIKCEVCHLNEGHAAPAVLERARSFMQEASVSFAVALNCTRVGNIFTTHTPVAAAFDRFSSSMFRHYLSNYADSLGISVDRLLGMGRTVPEDDNESFNMAWLALRGCGAVNGVSQLHGEVSRKIFKKLFPRWPEHEVPMGHITNGIHIPSWNSKEADELWETSCGKERWLWPFKRLEADFNKVDDETLWQFRTRSRQRLIEFCRTRINCHQAIADKNRNFRGSCMDPNVFTMGFARRFASYKRPNLLLHDPDRLSRLLNRPGMPVQLVIAGKAHPENQEGKAMIREWVEYIDRPDIQGKILFIEDYDMTVATQMTQGVDLWINTPKRPWEASGTSGMKVLVNGGINVSERDGWWAEAHCSEVGWSLGDGKEHDNDPEWDGVEARELYRLLEEEIVPEFYQRDSKGISRDWVTRMRLSMARLTPQFSTNRMLRQYTEELYIPAAEALRDRMSNGGKTGKDIEVWRQHINRHWSNIHFGNMDVEQAADNLVFRVQIYLDDLEPDDLVAELYADPSDNEGQPECWQMERKEKLAGSVNGFTYEVTVPARRLPSDYTPRVRPWRQDVVSPLEDAHILWMR
ncbi:MAG: alpha-glucan family phosphorylase [Desulfobulbaceae bacterium]|nr:alpha-glucan family phosphorylase [Desulfobulbaceae bacterium]